jgi:uncharacterized membrane protein
MRLKNRDLIIAVIIAVLNVGWALLPSHTLVIGIILALPLVFWLPGYTLSKAIFHRQSLDAPHLLLSSLGLSLAIDILSGLILNMLPIGLQAVSWAVLLGLLTVVFSLLVWYLRRGAALLNRIRPLRFHFTISGYILFGVAIAVTVLSVLYAAIGAAQQPQPGFTQLWMLPAVQTGKSCAVRLGMRSFESTPVTYRITMAVNGTQVTPWPSIVLAPQEEWDRLVPITPRAANDIAVEAQLYQLNKPEAVYREVHLTLYSCPTSRVTPTPYPSLTSAYSGTIHDLVADLTTEMSLTKIQQNEGGIHGYFTAGAGLQGSGPFRGIVAATKKIQFTVTDGTGHATFSFEGGIDTYGDVAGSYCRFDKAGSCTDGYGVWSVAPTSP